MHSPMVMARTQHLLSLFTVHACNGWVIVSVDDLRTVLCLGTKYRRFSAFRVDVLQPVVDALNQQGHWVRWQSVTKHRGQGKGRKKDVIHFTFTLVMEPELSIDNAGLAESETLEQWSERVEENTRRLKTKCQLLAHKGRACKSSC